MMEQPRRRMQSDQPIAQRPQPFMPPFDLLGQCWVKGNRRRHGELKVRHRFSSSSQHQPCQYGCGDHQDVQQSMHHMGEPNLPNGWPGAYRRRVVHQAPQQANPDQRKDRKTKQPVQAQAPLPSELEPMQAALNRLLGQIQEVLSRERRFIADAAHEMRTPLAVLRVHAQNVLEAQNDEQRRESLNYLVVGVDRTTRLVNQLLTIARLEPGTGPVKTQQADLVATVRESLAQMTPWVLSRGLELSFECNEQAHLLNTDFAAIDISLQNLITNAVNFSPADGQINVALVFKYDGYELSVADQGPGISAGDRERLFERFYSKGNDQGVGLGLAIVQTVAMRLGGAVRLENRVPAGLIAILEIPVASQ